MAGDYRPPSSSLRSLIPRARAHEGGVVMILIRLPGPSAHHTCPEAQKLPDGCASRARCEGTGCRLTPVMRAVCQRRASEGCVSGVVSRTYGSSVLCVDLRASTGCRGGVVSSGVLIILSVSVRKKDRPSATSPIFLRLTPDQRRRFRLACVEADLTYAELLVQMLDERDRGKRARGAVAQSPLHVADDLEDDDW